MEYFNGFFYAKFYSIVNDINENNENNESLNESNKGGEEDEHKLIIIKVLYKTYLANKKLVNLSRILTMKSENGSQLELELNLDIKNLELYDKFMQIFIKNQFEKSILIGRNQIIDIANLVFKYDLVIPIKKYIIDTLINHYTFFPVNQLENLANLYQISELNDFIKEKRLNISNSLTRLMDLTTTLIDNKKIKNLKM